VRRLISVGMLALAAGTLSPAVGAAAATAARPVAGPQSQSFGARLVDVPVSEANNPRGLRYIIDYLPVGTVIHRRILIQNGESRSARFTVYPGAATIAKGAFVGDAGATRNELTRWISVQHPSVTLAPNSSVMDMITIKVPPGATRGEHYGAIWVQQTAQSHATTGFGVTEVSRVGIRVYLAVGRGGAPPTVFAITSITARRSASGQPIITTYVDNTGGRAVDLSGSARLTDGPAGSSAGPFPAQQVLTLAPGQTGTVTFAPPKSLPNGGWKVTVNLVSGITTCTATASIEFHTMVAAQAGLSGMKWILIGFGVLILIALVLMTFYALQHRSVAARRSRGPDGPEDLTDLMT
jgi:hypothetical protein